MIDLFTRFAVAVPVPDMSAQTVIDAVLMKWFLVFGAPRRIHSDQGTNFESAAFGNFCALWNVMKSRTTAYHPAGNGACERVNQTLNRGVQKILNEKNLENWDLILPLAVFSYNSTVHSTTEFTPFI